MHAIRIATVGDNCIDRYQPPIGLSTVGGNAVNVAVQLRRLGQKVAYFGAVGSDAEGERMLGCFRENGLDVSHVRVAAGRTAYTDIGTDAAGDRTILFEDFGVCRAYRPGAQEVEALRGMRHVHIGWLDDAGTLKRALAAAGVSVSQDLSVNADPRNLRPEGLSIAFASAEGSRERGEMLLMEMLGAGAATAVVTCGALGSLASNGRSRAEVGVAPTSVVDTTGAGDTFIAGFIAAHLKGRSLRACLQSGRNAAATTCMHLGGFPQIPLTIR